MPGYTNPNVPTSAGPPSLPMGLAPGGYMAVQNPMQPIYPQTQPPVSVPPNVGQAPPQHVKRVRKALSIIDPDSGENVLDNIKKEKSKDDGGKPETGKPDSTSGEVILFDVSP